MDKVFLGPAKSFPVVSPRFSLGRTAGGRLAACLWLWTSAGALAAPAALADPAAASAYHRALDRFNQADYARALALLEHASANGTAAEQADILNLRGAVYLRQDRYEQAQAEFDRASKLDHNLWAARFNAAEVSFRQKRYAESRRQFAALLDQTSRLFHNEEHGFVQYKMLLAGLCAGDEKPALDFVADYRDAETQPLAWYYLNAALDERHNRPQQAGAWLALADTRFVADSGRTYAESFDRLGWGTARTKIAAGPDAWHNAHRLAIAETTVAKTPVALPRASSAAEFASALADSRTPPPQAVAVMAIQTEPVRVSFHDSSSDPAALPDARPGALAATPPETSAALSSSDFPPGDGEASVAFAGTGRAGAQNPATLARPRKSHATPSPTPDASATPADETANQGGTPASAATPSDEFTGKYEAAYAKFLEKDYTGTLALLDEADKIQPGQSQSISLRFKSHYALAYIEYRKQNYFGALGELDLADQTQKNADSYNLRGLVFSKQHNYDQAEAMFHKAITTDPALWAAKFNYAELPFNRGNYTDARTRFEELFSQTDPAKQPREAELTQYKVFLTLLLEGKVEQASSFMDHLTFSGATPARYFCNAALNFRSGSVDRAKNWIDDAKKEFPPQLVAIFIESFYRLGWMVDPNAPPGTAIAQASPGGTPSVTTSGTLPTTVATATTAPSATPTGTTAASTPIVVAAASPLPTPFVGPTAPARPAASAPPAVVSATPTASPARNLAAATVSPVPAASAPPVVVVVPAASPARSVASATVAPRPAASAPPVAVVATPAITPARTVAQASASPVPTGTPIIARATPAPSVHSAGAAIDASTEQAKKNRRRVVVLILVLVQTLYYVSAVRGVLRRRKQSDLRAAARRRAMVESSK